jgi:hypothetical protein
MLNAGLRTANFNRYEIVISLIALFSGPKLCLPMGSTTRNNQLPTHVVTVLNIL